MKWILGLFIGLCVFILIKGAMFKPKKRDQVTILKHDFDLDKAIDHLSKLIQYKTVSSYDEDKYDLEVFEGFKEELTKLYPKFHDQVECTYIEPRGILYCWKGKSAAEPILFMAHYDVVPVDEEYWNVEPFAGIVKEGILYGRGTLDTKGTLCGLLEASEYLMMQGFIPDNDIYFAFGGDEETLSISAPNIVDYLEKQGIFPKMVLDEGGVIVENQFPGVSKKMALIGTAEKGGITLEISVKSNGGHSSAPPSKQSIGIMADIIKKIEKAKLPALFTEPVIEMFEHVGRNSTFLYRVIFGNIWLFKPFLIKLFSYQGGQMNAIIRSTFAMTMLEGSKAYNVMPPIVKMTVNIRPLPGDSTDDILNYIEKEIGNEHVELKVIEKREASKISGIENEFYNKLEESIIESFGDIIVSPFLMTGATDSRHYTRICDNVYRFTGMHLTSEEIGLIHSNNECIRIDTVKENINFFINLISKF